VYPPHDFKVEGKWYAGYPIRRSSLLRISGCPTKDHIEFTLECSDGRIFSTETRTGMSLQELRQDKRPFDATWFDYVTADGDVFMVTMKSDGGWGRKPWSITMGPFTVVEKS